MARIGRILAWTVAAVVGVPLLLVAVILVGGNTGPGRHLIERLTPTLTGGEIRIAGLAGRFPDRLRAAHFELRDKDGAYLTIDGLTFDWSPLQLLHATLLIDRLDATEADFARMPVASGSSSSSGLPVRIALQQMQIDRLRIGAAVAGQTVLLSATGSGALELHHRRAWHPDRPPPRRLRPVQPRRQHHRPAPPGHDQGGGAGARADLRPGRAAGPRAGRDRRHAGRPAECRCDQPRRQRRQAARASQGHAGPGARRGRPDGVRFRAGDDAAARHLLAGCQRRCARAGAVHQAGAFRPGAD